MGYLIGLDLGTTSVKACLFHEDGKFVHAVELPIETIYEDEGFCEQDVDVIEAYSRDSIRQLIDEAQIEAQYIIGCSFSSAMHSLVAIDEQEQPLTRAMIWSDRRSATSLASMSEEEKQDVYERTGTPIHPMSPYSKLLWVKSNQPQLYSQVKYWMSIKEYVILKWFNVRWVDYSMASATGLLSIYSKSWDKELLAKLELDEKQFSIIKSPTELLPSIDENIAKQMGIQANTPFVLGAADGQLASLGVGAVGEGEIALSVGTSGAVRAFSTYVHTSENRATFCYAFDDSYYIVGGPTNNGGIVLQWVKQLIASEMDYNAFIDLAAQSDIGANGLIFLPFVNGERAPLWNAEAKGNFYGLTVGHQQSHIVRAILEGITFNLYHILKELSNGKNIECIYVNGGLARSTLWLHMLANIFNVKVITAETHHGAAWGACWLALIGLGQQSNIMDIKPTIQYNQTIVPDGQQHIKYSQIYGDYQKVLSVVKELY